jgi:hypothetical protein
MILRFDCRRRASGRLGIARNRRSDHPPPRGPRRGDLRIASPQGRDDGHHCHGDVRLRPNRPGPTGIERRWRQPRSGCGWRRLVGRNRPAAATRRWRARERFVAADAVVIKLGADYPGFHPLVPKRSVGVFVPVAHGQIAVTPSTTRAEALRHVRLVRVRRISAGNRRRKKKRRSTNQYRGATTSKPESHSDSLKQRINTADSKR